MNKKKFTNMGYKMQGFGSKAGLPKIEDKNPPRQKGENPDLEVINDNKRERINDLEDRIQFLNDDIAEETGPTQKKADMMDTLKMLKSKLKALKA